MNRIYQGRVTNVELVNPDKKALKENKWGPSIPIPEQPAKNGTPPSGNTTSFFLSHKINLIRLKEAAYNPPTIWTSPAFEGINPGLIHHKARWIGESR